MGQTPRDFLGPIFQPPLREPWEIGLGVKPVEESLPVQSRVFLDAFLQNYRWWRRRRGGVWERWWIDSPVNGFSWFRFEEPTDGRRPPLCCGTPIVEDYRRRALDVPDVWAEVDRRLGIDSRSL